MTSSPPPFSYAALPRKRVAAGALLTDAAGRVLLVEPTYKPDWEIPGGVVEEGEAAPAACARECREELGLDVRVGRLLVVEHQTQSLERGDSVMFVYDGGTLADHAVIALPAVELRSWAFVPPDAIASRTVERLARRLHHALEARRTGALIELVDGHPVG